MCDGHTMGYLGGVGRGGGGGEHRIVNVYTSTRSSCRCVPCVQMAGKTCWLVERRDRMFSWLDRRAESETYIVYV